MTNATQTFKPNPGKNLDMKVGNETYLRLPIKTDLITEKNELMPLLEKYLKDRLLPGDVIFVSEKVVCVTQGRIININDIKPSKFARFFRIGCGTIMERKILRGLATARRWRCSFS